MKTGGLRVYAWPHNQMERERREAKGEGDKVAGWPDIPKEWEIKCRRDSANLGDI